MAYVNHSFTFFLRQLIASTFSSVLTVFCKSFTWIALGNGELRLSLSLVTKANAIEGGTKTAA
jgi:hypothetical protein